MSAATFDPIERRQCHGRIDRKRVRKGRRRGTRRRAAARCAGMVERDQEMVAVAGVDCDAADWFPDRLVGHGGGAVYLYVVLSGWVSLLSLCNYWTYGNSETILLPNLPPAKPPSQPNRTRNTR